MNTKFTLITGLVLGLGSALAAADLAKPASRVEIQFIHPEKFTDCKDAYHDTGRARDNILAEFRSTFEQLATRYLAEGQHLEIKVTDIDLAGDFEPWRQAGYENVRYVREVYPPRMDLEFRLTGPDGTLLREDKRRLQQMGFMKSVNPINSGSLRYEKEMLRDWMAREFRRPS